MKKKLKLIRLKIQLVDEENQCLSDLPEWVINEYYKAVNLFCYFD